MEALLQRVASRAALPQLDVSFGTSTSQQSASLVKRPAGAPQDRYLVASLTKPIVAMALLKLAGDAEVALTERLGVLLPSFQKSRFRRITLRHLLTHTSGFADMLPNNAELRASHAGLAEFLGQASNTELEFQPATDCRYSSIGFLLIGAIIEKLTNEPLGVFLRKQFFEPLRMTNTWLGLSDANAETILPTVLPNTLPNWQESAGDWGWNSRYWRMLGAPWGGLISTSKDLGNFCRMMLQEGTTPNGQQLLPCAVVKAAVRDQTADAARQPTYVGQHRPWGFGWRLQWPSHLASFGDFVSHNSVGHWGATGTLMWIDPDHDSFAVILSTMPYEQSQSSIQCLSNAIAICRE